jgi:hypothetical protein
LGRSTSDGGFILCFGHRVWALDPRQTNQNEEDPKRLFLELLARQGIAAGNLGAKAGGDPE